MHGILPKMVEIMHSNVMLCFMMQAFQDPRYVAAPFICRVNGDDITTLTPTERKFYAIKEEVEW
jgi:hypothetical protein